MEVTGYPGKLWIDLNFGLVCAKNAENWTQLGVYKNSSKDLGSKTGFQVLDSFVLKNGLNYDFLKNGFMDFTNNGKLNEVNDTLT